MNKAETMLRQMVREKMNGVWIPTWHEAASGATFGIPDISFIFKGNYETGWLELKAEFRTGDNKDSVKFKIRPDQHTWIEKHHEYVPVLLLCQWGPVYYLIEGKNHKHLNRRLSPTELIDISMAAGAGGWLRNMLTQNLQEVTDRFRNVE